MKEEKNHTQIYTNPFILYGVCSLFFLAFFTYLPRQYHTILLYRESGTNKMLRNVPKTRYQTVSYPKKRKTLRKLEKNP